MKLHPKSAWSKAEIFSYLERTNTPLRVSCVDADGYPIICSLRFVFYDGALWGASHKNAHLIKAIKNNPKVGFEVATNEYPYHGVRGKAEVTLLADSSENVLQQVIDKYLQGSNKKLADWLMSRQQDEYALKISPSQINSWDFSQRMSRG